jgi:biopolymer transport protein ExbB
VRLKNQDKRFHQQFWASSLDSAAELSHELPGPAARVAQAGYAAIAVGDTQANDLSHAINHQDRLERALRQQIVRERRSLETGLAVVASIGSTSPFIGLFGTVWGIMEALKGISAAGSASLETVAGPIGAALVATGVGIAVAVPAVLVYNYFLRRLKLTAADLDDFAHDFYSLAQKSAFRVLVHPAVQSPGRFHPASEGGVLIWPFRPRTATKC